MATTTERLEGTGSGAPEQTASKGPPEHVRIAIVGAGFSGLGMAIRLKQEGIEDFVVLERAEDIGGTWQANTYPGCQCDVPSHLYSFSFAPNPGWTRTFSKQQEIWDYLRRVADEHGLGGYVRTGHEVLSAEWEEEVGLWRLETSQGPFSAQFLVGGMGGLSEPKLPDIPGIDSFEGAAFHSARWDHDHDIAGKRVGVVGTGASTVQIVPSIQPKVERLHVFQRTPTWVMPHNDRPISRLERRLYRRFPGAQRAMRSAIYWGRESFVLWFRHPKLARRVPERIARRHLTTQVSDPELRRRLTPTFRFGCKRVLPSNAYYPALTQPNVELVTDGIEEVTPKGVRTSDGSERELDTLVFATGFHVTDMPATRMVRGRDGLLLDDVWQGSPQAYMGTTVAGFPNFFLLLGPNTGLGHTSVVFMIECQLAYIIDCLRAVQRRGLTTIEPRPDAQARFVAEIARHEQGTVWTDGGCVSWYLDRTGRNATLWPGSTVTFKRRTRRFDLENYATTPAPSASPSRVGEQAQAAA
ncbi:MAG: flavin-containing monooxygenase [Solirubrobacteraceae bacterium]